MAMRPRTSTGTPPSRPRAAACPPVYEDFKPISEWKEESSSHLLLVYLPGFMKENIKVQVQSGNVIRVRGERLVTGNKWNRFLEDFRLPQNCDTNTGTRAKFEGGILTITIPKKTTTTAAAETKPKTTTQQQAQAPPRMDVQKPIQPKADFGKQRDHGSNTTTTIPPPTPPKDEQTDKGKTTSLIATTSSTTKLGGSPENIVHDTTKGKTTTDFKLPENAFENTIRKEKQSGEKIKESVKAEGGVDEVKEKSTDATTVGAPEEKAKAKAKDKAKETKDVTTADGGFKLDDYKQAVRGLNHEDRKLILNMGVAVLVIVALGAYISCTFGSSGKPNN
uniref:Putative inactive protein RESTRICTED TEV MOVEMENT 2 n=1 Tax=Davidia involucrata TaxID=16924 RepID=A0A5B6YIA6_DAVIN